MQQLWTTINGNGPNQQVKRMIGALGGFVDSLHRLAIGPLGVPSIWPLCAS